MFVSDESALLTHSKSACQSVSIIIARPHKSKVVWVAAEDKMVIGEHGTSKDLRNHQVLQCGTYLQTLASSFQL
jgi:hypothetical protein